MRMTFQSVRLPAVAVFTGSFLLFLVQPLLGRTLLPMFGGSAAVWGVCLAVYQVLLLAGYAYAHGVSSRPVRTQRRLHLGLLAVAVVWTWAFAFLRLRARGAFGASSMPSLEVAFCVLLFAGLPYVLLASGSTLVQSWLVSSAREGASTHGVYRLYALSNLGSFLGLLVYPFVLEPFVPLTLQWYGFGAGVLVYAGLLWRWRPAVTDSHAEIPRSRSAPFRGLWFLLPGVSAFLLNAAVSHLFIDVTPMPLVWVVMLASFLLSYVVGFSRAGEALVGLWCGGAAVAMLGAGVANGLWGTGSFYPNAGASLALVFFVGVVLHGWLYASRPQPSGLTRYYLAIAAGGAAGGLMAGLVAPWIFRSAAEYPLALLVSAVLVAARMPKPACVSRSTVRATVFVSCCVAVWSLFAWAAARHTTSRTVWSGRNFYGCLRVTRTLESFGQRGNFPVYYLWCGQTTHGIQVRAPFYKGRGTAYYGRTGGGIAVEAHPKAQSGEGMRVGVVGLGAGTMACYGRPCDLYRFFEINPLVVKVATDPSLFTFLPDAQPPIDLVEGDARQMLERERKAGDPLYDVLVIDAYSGDAVPYHLATREAFSLYMDRLAPGGILAVHVSNWHIDLLPLCKAVAADLGLHPYGVVGTSEDSVTSAAMWVFLTREPMAYRFPGKPSVREVVWENVRDVSVPSDDQGSLIPLLRF